jgi:hypothetical protein
MMKCAIILDQDGDQVRAGTVRFSKGRIKVAGSDTLMASVLAAPITTTASTFAQCSFEQPNLIPSIASFLGALTAIHAATCAWRNDA